MNIQTTNRNFSNVLTNSIQNERSIKNKQGIIKVRVLRTEYLGTLGTSDQSLSYILSAENRRSLDIIPVLLSERIDSVTNQNLQKWKTSEMTKSRDGKKKTIERALRGTYAFFFPPFLPLDIRLFFLQISSETLN